MIVGHNTCVVAEFRRTKAQLSVAERHGPESAIAKKRKAHKRTIEVKSTKKERPNTDVNLAGKILRPAGPLLLTLPRPRSGWCEGRFR